MKCLTRILTGLIWISGILSLLADDVPIAPILLETSSNDHQAYQLTSKHLSLQVSPEKGGIVVLNAPGEENFLSSPITFKISEDEKNEIWESRAWRTNEGKQVVMLKKNIMSPQPLRIVHFIELSTTGEKLIQSTRITSLGPGDQHLLRPLYQIALRAPDEEMSIENQTNLSYAENQLLIKTSWEIEDPEIRLAEVKKIVHLENSLVCETSPPSELELPPQGWSLLAKIEFQLSDIDISATQPESELQRLDISQP